MGEEIKLNINSIYSFLNFNLSTSLSISPPKYKPRHNLKQIGSNRYICNFKLSKMDTKNLIEIRYFNFLT